MIYLLGWDIAAKQHTRRLSGVPDACLVGLAIMGLWAASAPASLLIAGWLFPPLAPPKGGEWVDMIGVVCVLVCK